MLNIDKLLFLFLFFTLSIDKLLFNIKVFMVVYMVLI